MEQLVQLLTEEPAQNSPTLFNKTLNCFSETTHQHLKPQSWSVHREEDFEPQQPLGRGSPHHTHIVRDKGMLRYQIWNMKKYEK